MLENRKALSEYRLQTAMEKVEAAKLLLDDGKHKDAANRAYYAMFHAVRAILALDGVDFKKHSGVISYFRQQYIATGIFGKELSVMLGDAFLVRNQSDYEDFYVVSKAQAVQQYENARTFCEEVRKYLEAQSDE